MTVHNVKASANVLSDFKVKAVANIKIPAVVKIVIVMHNIM